MGNYLDTSKFKSSSIGTTVDSVEDVKVDCKYSFISKLFITFFGTTRMPLEISFTCLKTGELFEQVTDKDLIKHYMHFERH